MSGSFLDFRAGPGGAELVETPAVLERLLAWTGPARAQLGIQVDLPARNGAQRAREALAAGSSIEDLYRDVVAETKRTYTADVGARR
jgi:hypothetical protein